MIGAMPAGAIQFIGHALRARVVPSDCLTVYEKSKKELNTTFSDQALGWAKPWGECRLVQQQGRVAW